jgi:uncharacterized protein
MEQTRMAARKIVAVKRTILWLGFVVLVACSCRWTTPTFQSSNSNTPAPSPSPTIQAAKLTGPITDLSNILDDKAESRLKAQIAAVKTRADFDFAVLTIPTTNGQPISDYSLAAARSWSTDEANERQVLLVIAIKDREWHIQVTRALETQLPKQVCKELGDASNDYYKRAQYEVGFSKLIKGVEDTLLKSKQTASK